MPICPDCRPFAPKDVDTDPEIELSVHEDENTHDVSVTGTVRIVNTCENCSQELEEATFEVEVDMTEIAKAHRALYPAERHNFEIDDAEGERLDERQTKDRRGNPIRNPRYMKRLYGARVTITLGCSCGEDVEGAGEFVETIAASYMEGLV